MGRKHRSTREQQAQNPSNDVPASVERHDNSFAQQQLGEQTAASRPDHGVLQAAITQLAGSGPEPAGEGMAAGMVGPALPPGFADTLGLTKPSSDFVAPEVVVTAEERDAEDWWDFSTHWVANVAPTTSRDAVHWAVATPPGLHDMGNETFDLKDGPESFKMLLEVTQADFSSIVDAEQEHLDDFQQAYDITLKAAADTVNDLAQSDFYGDTEKEARTDVLDTINDRLHTKLSVSYPETASIQWRIACSNLILGTERDANGWHSVKVVAKNDGIDIDNHTITHRLDFSGTQIGTHPSSKHVTLD